LNEVFINNDALVCGLVFQERPETLRPFMTVFVSDLVAASDIANLMVLPDGSGGDEIVAELASSGGAGGMLVSTIKLCFHDGGNKQQTDDLSFSVVDRIIAGDGLTHFMRKSPGRKLETPVERRTPRDWRCYT
jgi:hypothetical protein